MKYDFFNSSFEHLLKVLNENVHQGSKTIITLLQFQINRENFVIDAPIFALKWLMIDQHISRTHLSHIIFLSNRYYRYRIRYQAKNFRVSYDLCRLLILIVTKESPY